ncbi:MAG: zincin-like metallopeptidase domain-containing protein [Acidiphilium sp.]|nr:zincin-like metallopeptidase domain-containing protein [Acidiphilium sp.]
MIVVLHGCWSDEDYAEWDWCDHTVNRALPSRCGIIRISALWPLCRCRHNSHATGHPTRLNRPDLGTPFGSASYAREELRAEIASLMMADRMGIGHDPGQHAAYVGGWIKALKEEPREIFRAAADAEKIAGYLTDLRQERKAAQTTTTLAATVATPPTAPTATPEQAYWQRAAERGRAIQAETAAARTPAERAATNDASVTASR